VVKWTQLGGGQTRHLAGGDATNLGRVQSLDAGRVDAVEVGGGELTELGVGETSIWVSLRPPKGGGGERLTCEAVSALIWVLANWPN